ncbi:hypothetical protein [Umezawaea beigongshangensis]|uniref:hypothetical protein n=1 Tax=Umezawaea beigongshangensis TaxID=2780383 RepID=UPI0018F11114|nr:hypothetical protein [Umezawaea beigongshangensis]
MGSRVVGIDADGNVRDLAPAGGVPFRPRADAGGGVVFVDRDGADGRVRRVADGRVQELARGDGSAVLRATTPLGISLLEAGVARWSAVPLTTGPRRPVLDHAQKTWRGPEGPLPAGETTCVLERW